MLPTHNWQVMIMASGNTVVATQRSETSQCFGRSEIETEIVVADDVVAASSGKSTTSVDMGLASFFALFDYSKCTCM